jgi:hypothetical protein
MPVLHYLKCSKKILHGIQKLADLPSKHQFVTAAFRDFSQESVSVDDHHRLFSSFIFVLLRQNLHINFPTIFVRKIPL